MHVARSYQLILASTVTVATSAAAGADGGVHEHAQQGAAAAAHSFWGMAGNDAFTGIDVVPNPNNCTKCFAAGNFVRSVGARIKTQPNCNCPHPSGGCPSCKPPIKPTPGWRPVPVPGSQEMNRTVAALMNPLYGGGAGRRSLTFDGGAPCGNHHPADNIFAKYHVPGAVDACKDPTTGKLANWSGIWWDHGAAQIAVDWAEYLSNLKAAGGEFDVVTLDTECGFDAFSVTSWQTRYNPAITEACQNQHFEAIQSDTRFPAVLALLKENGFVQNGTGPTWLADSLIWEANDNFNSNMAAWQAVMTQRTVAYKNIAYYAPAKAANPAVIVSDYDDVTWSTGACTIDLNGFWANGCNHANNTVVTGNRQAPDFYGWMHNMTDGKNFPGSAQTLGHEFQISPFNSLLWGVYQMRMYQFSAPHIPVKPWLAVRSYCGDGGYGPPVLGSNPRVGWCNTDFYQEMVFHLGLLGADDFLLFNPCFGTCTKDQKPNGTAMMTLADNEMYSTMFTELSAIVGFENRSWIQEPTPGGWRCAYVLSGMTTPVSRVWRFTSKDGKPTSHLMQDGTTVILAAKQPGGSNMSHVVFEMAKIVASATAGATRPVSAVGLWINQSLAAPIPENWQCSTN